MIRAVQKIIILLVFSLSIATLAKGQASWETFGQQRIQYRTFTWKYFDSTHFRAFYYRPGEEIAKFILSDAEQELSNIVQIMGGRLPRKLNLIIYNNYNDYVQTNIGRQNDQDFNQADGGKVEVVGDNIPIYFTGSHEDLKNQVRKGIAKVIKDNMLFGNNIKEVVKNAIKMNLPEWYTQGYVQYISEDWTPEKATEVRSIIEKDTTNSFRKLANIKPNLIGHSFWNFLSIKYGTSYVSNLLYLTRYRKGVNDALVSVLRKDADSVYQEWSEFYARPIAADVDSNFGKKLITTLPSKFAATYNNFHLSPNGRQLAYVEKKEGIWSIYLQETDLKDSKVLITGGLRNTRETNDPNYPLIAWSPSGKQLAILYPYKNQLVLRMYNAITQAKYTKIISSRKIERVTGMCFTANEAEFIFSGIKKGQSDIFRYTIRGNRVTNITNDRFDDKEPSYVNSGVRNGVLFLSNRTRLILDDPIAQKSQNFDDNFNVYFYDETQQKKVIQVTDTDKKIVQPVQYGLDNFSYIEELDGKRLRTIVSFDKNDSLQTTFTESATADIPYNILSQQYQHQNGTLQELIKVKGEYRVFNTSLQKLYDWDTQNPPAPRIVREEENKKEKKEVAAPYITEYKNIDTTSNLYNIFSGRNKKLNRFSKKNSDNTLFKLKRKKYKPTFYPDFIISSLDNSLLFTRYQPYQQGQGFQFPSLGGFVTMSLNDIMEDYKITGGIRLPLDFNGLAYFLEFANVRKRRDWKITYFHTHRNVTYDASQAPDTFSTPYIAFEGKTSTDYLESKFVHPFNQVNSLHLSVGVRYDRIRYLATDQYSITFPNQQQFWTFSRLEYIHDNTVNPLLNIWKGTRAKVYGEYQYRLSGPTQGFYNFGIDARNYLTLYKNCILASRVAAGFSGGNAKLLYYLGGVDNPITINPANSIETNNPPDPEQNYAFQTTATNLRGYKLQARNGNSYAVINEEIRLPIHNTFIKRNIKSGFLRNLQLVAFTDIGSAWRGLMPNEDNISITKQINGGNVNVLLESTENILAWGYGVGVRTRLLGYFMRLDAAWNIEGNPKPMWHLSLATDF